MQDKYDKTSSNDVKCKSTLIKLFTLLQFTTPFAKYTPKKFTFVAKHLVVHNLNLNPSLYKKNKLLTAVVHD